MNIEDLHKMWAIDGKIDEADIVKETTKIPSLHNKYFHLYVQEGLRLKKLKADYKILVKLKSEYYRGELDEDELKEHGWKPQPLKILKQDIPSYVESDSDIINASLKIGYREAIVDYLESIVRQINNRNFYLKNIVDWNKFTQGQI